MVATTSFRPAVCPSVREVVACPVPPVVLVVGVNSDVSTRRLKGPTRPINGERDRAAGSTVDPNLAAPIGGGDRLGFEVTGGTPAEFTAVMQSEAQRWSKVIREANVKAE